MSPLVAPDAGTLLGRHLELIEAGLGAAIGDAPLPMDAAARYVLGWEDAEGGPAANQGKRIRPALCLLAAELVGGDVASALPGAVAVELVHNFSLVHDEVQDHDLERHHRPTIWARMGEAQAINVGNFLSTRAVQTLAAAPGDPGRALHALRVLNTAIGEMLAGQWADIAFESRDDVTVEEYLAMVAGKTGALIGAPLEMGTILAGADPALAAGLGRWGRQVGLAFQAQDDYLGTWGDPELTGKSNTNDIARRKKSLPVILGMSDPSSREVVRSAFAGSDALDSEGVHRVIAALEGVGADQATRERAAAYADAGRGLLADLALTDEARSALAAVATYLVDRAG